MKRSEILQWLRETDPAEVMRLFKHADAVRRANVGEAVHLLGIVEVSNHCERDCAYCGLRSSRHALQRYRMPEAEVVSRARKAAAFGCTELALQSGDDPQITRDWVSGVVRQVKAKTQMAVTLNFGERPEDDLAAWRQAGADRCLLRFETSDRELFHRIHPSQPGRLSDRIGWLKKLRGLGYRVGSGVMVGIPGQSYQSLARDIQLFEDLDLDMIAIGPYLSHPATPLGAGELSPPLEEGSQVPNTEDMVYRVLALARRVCPRVHIPTTAALASMNTANGRELGLIRGANMVVVNVTPKKYRKMYDVFPNRVCLREPSDGPGELLRARILGIGRRIAISPPGRLSVMSYV